MSVHFGILRAIEFSLRVGGVFFPCLFQALVRNNGLLDYSSSR